MTTPSPSGDGVVTEFNANQVFPRVTAVKYTPEEKKV